MYFGFCVVCDVNYEKVCTHLTCPHCCLACWYVTRKPKIFEVPRFSLVDAFHNLRVRDGSVFHQHLPPPNWSTQSFDDEDYFVNESDSLSDIETLYDFIDNSQ